MCDRRDAVREPAGIAILVAGATSLVTRLSPQSVSSARQVIGSDETAI
jgi:hypothetical protein